MSDPEHVSVAGLRVLAHALADSLAALAEPPGSPSEWRLRVAAAQARAIEDLLSGITEPEAPSAPSAPSNHSHGYELAQST